VSRYRAGRRFVASRTGPTYGSVAPQRRSRAECQYVMEALGDLPLRVAYERLAGMVRMLGEDVQAMALRNAYAIDMLVPDTLTRRRERIAGIHGLSIDTIELYERNMIDELALPLPSRQRRGRPHADQTPPVSVSNCRRHHEDDQHPAGRFARDATAAGGARRFPRRGGQCAADTYLLRATDRAKTAQPESGRRSWCPPHPARHSPADYPAPGQ
jgi:hypothetical protein